MPERGRPGALQASHYGALQHTPAAHTLISPSQEGKILFIYGAAGGGAAVAAEEEAAARGGGNTRPDVELIGHPEITELGNRYFYRYC
ncbi:hypothetical protein E2C01_015105 [Portunus trituberculatus]|uniref:Uncharacterized protein n=1 Tax=Portunus trituberculatus TaxID=210409 RepID=A0A5B7DLY2_PORTR|nr:hypothetical protein [Portunus trituberculatus]